MVRSRAAWLGLLAVVTLGGLVYLFLQVTADPTTAASAAGQSDGAGARIAATETAPPEPGGGKAARPVTPFRPTMSSGHPKKPEAEPAAEPERPSLAPEEPPKDESKAGDAELAEAMAEATKHYDNNDYESAQKQALRVLAKEPENTRMLRVVVSSACVMGDGDTAAKYFPSLPAGRDQSDMVKRCEKYQVKLPEAKPVYPKGGSRGGITPIR